MNPVRKQNKEITSMHWYQYLAVFFAGFLLTNVVPHFVSGAIGSDFPSPFSSPPGVGLSSPLTNMIWSLINLILGYIFLRVSELNFYNTKAMLVLFLGISVCGVMLSTFFGSNPHL